MFIDETAPILYDVGSTQKNGEQIWAPVVEGMIFNSLKFIYLTIFIKNL